MALFRWRENEDLEEVKARKFEKTEGKEESVLESDLEEVLAKKPNALGEELFVVARQYGKFDGSSRKIDLLALGKDGNLVVVELKRTQDAGHAELQAIRYAAMVSNMTRDDLIRAYGEHSKKGLEDAEKDIQDHLGSDTQINTDCPRIVIASGGFSKELATSVFWLLQNSDLQITCVKLTLYDTGTERLLDTNKIIPLPQMEDYLVGIQRKKAQGRQTDLERKLWDFLNQERTIELMESASDHDRPAVERLQEPLLEQFGQWVGEDRTKKMIGKRIRCVLEKRGFEFVASGFPVGGPNLFTTGARYKRRIPNTNDESTAERA